MVPLGVESSGTVSVGDTPVSEPYRQWPPLKVALQSHLKLQFSPTDTNAIPVCPTCINQIPPDRINVNGIPDLPPSTPTRTRKNQSFNQSLTQDAALHPLGAWTAMLQQLHPSVSILTASCAGAGRRAHADRRGREPQGQGGRAAVARGGQGAQCAHAGLPELRRCAAARRGRSRTTASRTTPRWICRGGCTAAASASPSCSGSSSSSAASSASARAGCRCPWRCVSCRRRCCCRSAVYKAKRAIDSQTQGSAL